MSYLIKYICSNKNCNLSVSLSKVGRVWLTDMSIRVPNQKNIYKEGLYRDDEACIECKTISSIITDSREPKSEPECPECHKKDSFIKEGNKCHLCNDGVIIEDESSRIHFHMGGYSDEDEDRFISEAQKTN